MLQNIIQWFNALTIGKKIIAAIVVLGLLILLSPFTALLALLAMFVTLVAVVIQVLRRQPARKWAAALGVSFIALLMFSGISAAIYGGGAPEEATLEEPTTTQEEAAPETTREETTTAAPKTQPEEAKEDSSEDSEQDRQEQRSQDRQPSEQAAAPPEPEPAPEPEPEPVEEDPLAQLGTAVNVSRVVDGDTIEVSPAIDSIEDVRLIGVDTPETYGGTEPYGAEASAFTESVLAGQQVALEFDVERVDQYGRLLAYVYLPDGSMFNEALVRQGYAQVATFPPNVRYTDRFLAAQEQARLEGAGLWGLPAGQLCQLADRGNGIGGGCVATEEPAPQPAPQQAPAPPPAPAPAPSGVMPSATAPDVDCSDFPAMGNPQDWYFPGDPHRLDADGDGLACEAG